MLGVVRRTVRCMLLSIHPRGGRFRLFQDRPDPVWPQLHAQAPCVTECGLPVTDLPLPERSCRLKPRPPGQQSSRIDAYLPRRCVVEKSTGTCVTAGRLEQREEIIGSVRRRFRAVCGRLCRRRSPAAHPQPGRVATSRGPVPPTSAPAPSTFRLRIRALIRARVPGPGRCRSRCCRIHDRSDGAPRQVPGGFRRGRDPFSGGYRARGFLPTTPRGRVRPLPARPARGRARVRRGSRHRTPSHARPATPRRRAPRPARRWPSAADWRAYRHRR